MISVSRLSKHYAGHTLFDDLGFAMGRRERLGVVGRNGHGKSTLVKIIAGLEEPDEGDVGVPRGYSIGHLRQHITFEGQTVLEAASTGLDAAEIWRAEKTLGGLGFATPDFDRDVGEFSGGWQMRLELARVLVSEPNLLLLDEPTNYLDIGTIRWLERHLSAWPGEILFVSHDRAFTDALATHILGIHRKKAVRMRGNTGAFWDQIALAEESMERERTNLEKKRQQTLEFVDRFRAKASKARQAQSKLKQLKNLDIPKELAKIHDLNFTFNAAPPPPKLALECRELTFGYDANRPLIDDLDLTVLSNDRIGIVGRNGAGKTTLVRLMTGELAPQSGQVSPHARLQTAVFDQGLVDRLNDRATVAEVLLEARGDGDLGAARAVAGSMQFSGDLALKTISVLSGGERSRVMLGQLISTPANLLILDEPTHHLDLPSCEAMIRAIHDFPGAVILVSHDEHLLRETTRRLIVFRDSGPEVIDQGYGEFLADNGWQDVDDTSAAPAADRPKVSKKELRRLKGMFRDRKRDVLAEVTKRIRTHESEITRLEARLEQELAELTAAATDGDNRAVAALSQSSGLLRKDIDTQMAAYETAGDELARLEKQLAAEWDDITRHES